MCVCQCVRVLNQHSLFPFQSSNASKFRHKSGTRDGERSPRKVGHDDVCCYIVIYIYNYVCCILYACEGLCVNLPSVYLFRNRYAKKVKSSLLRCPPLAHMHWCGALGFWLQLTLVVSRNIFATVCSYAPFLMEIRTF